MNNKIKLDNILEKVLKPARYIGGEHNSFEKDLKEMDITMAFCFPDIYEVGMSYQGLHILYNLINNQENFACERVFVPGLDMEEKMIEADLALLSLESKAELSEFDILGFTLQHEMSFTNILHILELGRIPKLKKDRDSSYPLVIAGGPSASNPEPLVDFIDLFIIGEGEEITLDLLELYNNHKKKGFNRKDFLLDAVKIEGIYVPEFYDISYNKDGTIKSREVNTKGVPERIKKIYIEDIDNMFVPENMIVPYIEIVHDRMAMEIFRGCTHGCRFCQAGMIYRPVRERSPEKLTELAEKLVDSTGYEDISLMSLSSCDYSNLNSLTYTLLKDLEDRKVSVSLPSLRLDSDIIDILKDIEKMKRTGLTFAPEAGSQRLRDVINKGIVEEDIENTLRYAFDEGWSRVKLYFIMGLPTETEEDILGIKQIGYKIRDIFFDRDKEDIEGDFHLTISTACFVPKAFTPFQWVGQDSRESFLEKTFLLHNEIKDPKISFDYHDPDISYIEGIFARGDRRLGRLLLTAYELGCRNDSWSESFDLDVWLDAIKKSDIDGDFYTRRERDLDEILPWDFIDIGVSKEYLINEYKKALKEETTKDCRLGCNNCGIEDCSMRGGL